MNTTTLAENEAALSPCIFYSWEELCAEVGEILSDITGRPVACTHSYMYGEWQLALDSPLEEDVARKLYPALADTGTTYLAENGWFPANTLNCDMVRSILSLKLPFTPKFAPVEPDGVWFVGEPGAVESRILLPGPQDAEIRGIIRRLAAVQEELSDAGNNALLGEEGQEKFGRMADAVAAALLYIRQDPVARLGEEDLARAADIYKRMF